MTQLEKRALYNLVRQNWLSNPSMATLPWQVEDYRAIQADELFERLRGFSVDLNKSSFVSYADNADSPEELVELLIADQEMTTEAEDQIYLIVFELWRRLVSERPSISIVCDELDYQINCYDSGKMSNFEPLQDAIANYLELLDEHVDAGIAPQEAFEAASAYSANNTGDFLYDFIAEQIDDDNIVYPQELLDGFKAYFEDDKRFIFLRARLLSHVDDSSANRLIKHIVDNDLGDDDLDFNLELLAFLTEAGNPTLFRTVVNHTAPLLKHEEEFLDLLSLSADYCSRLDLDDQEKLIQLIVKKRSSKPPEAVLNPSDPDLEALLALFK